MSRLSGLRQAVDGRLAINPSGEIASETVLSVIERETPALRGVATSCPFCTTISQAEEPSLFSGQDFVTWSSVGALTEGHLLVLPQWHVLSAAALESSDRDLLADYLDFVRDRLTEAYGPVCVFEHGPATEGLAVGCSIDHAHLHLLPWKDSLVARAVAALPHLAWRRYDNGISRGLSLVDVGSSYLLVEDADGCGAVGIGDEIPSQAVRRLVTAEQQRAEEWDWKKHPQTMTQRQTLRRLRRA